MKLSEVKNDYFEWLCDNIGVSIYDNEKDMENTYIFLVSKLHSIDFYYLVKNDDNRAEDGYKLREEYCDELANYNFIRSNLFLSYLQGPCSVFEMMVALSIRIAEDVIFDDEYDASYWFWKMIENLDLEEYTDEDYYELNGDYFVERAVENFLGRKYSEDGKGGLFPLHNPDGDQRDVEIWYQMSAYLLENYEVD